MKRLMTMISLLAPLCCLAATQTTTTQTESVFAEFVAHYIKHLVFFLGLLIGVLAFYAKSKRYSSKDLRFVSTIGYGIAVTVDTFACIYYPYIIWTAIWTTVAFSIIGFGLAWYTKHTPLSDIVEMPMPKS